MSGAALGFLIFFWGLILGGIAVSMKALLKNRQK